MKIIIILTIIAISTSIASLNALTTGILQQALADPSDVILNARVHQNCDPNFNNCNVNSGFVQNGPGGHENCNFNTHRDVQGKCNVN